MKKHFITSLIFMLAASFALQAQNQSEVMSLANHKIVFQLTSDDTLVHKALIKQIRNILKAAPNASVEVVGHNKGITLLQTSMTKNAADVTELKSRGVDFVACENSMRERKIKKEDLLSESRTVPAGIIEIVMKQEQGWSYIKAGF